MTKKQKIKIKKHRQQISEINTKIPKDSLGKEKEITEVKFQVGKNLESTYWHRLSSTMQRK